MTGPGSTPARPAVTPSPDTHPDRFQELRLVGVRVGMPSNSPVVLLKEAHGNRDLPIRIGAVEATAIAFAQQGLVSLSPLTHDLFHDVLEAVGIRLLSVRINSKTDEIFDADLVLSDGSIVRSRPSDAIALAICTGAMIEVSTDVIEEIGVERPDGQDT